MGHVGLLTAKLMTFACDAGSRKLCCLAGELTGCVPASSTVVAAFVRRLCVVLALASLGCDTPTAPSEASPITENYIAVLGDSLAVSPSREEAFPAVLGDRIERQSLPWRVINHGVRGDTTSGGQRRLDDLLRQDPAILILALGANDGVRGVEVSTISRNLSEIIARANSRRVRVLLCGMETLPLRGWAYTVAFHNIFPALAREHDVPLVPFLLAGVALNREMNLEDMIHPNAAGARRIADTIWPFLEPMLTTQPLEARRLE